MSLAGISKVSTSFSIHIGSLRDVGKLLLSSASSINVPFLQNQSYSLSVSDAYKTGQAFINVSKGVSTPSSGKVNLGFTSLYVGDNSSSVIGESLNTTFTSVSVTNALSYSYTKPQINSVSGNSAYIYVGSSNSEYEITLGLDEAVTPTVNAFYPNIQQQSASTLNDYDDWS